MGQIAGADIDSFSHRPQQNLGLLQRAFVKIVHHYSCAIFRQFFRDCPANTPARARYQRCLTFQCKSHDCSTFCTITLHRGECLLHCNYNIISRQRVYAALCADDGLRNLTLLTAPLDFSDKKGMTFARWVDE